MRFGSVCSGIEAASVAWGPLGWEAAWFSEIEPFPSAVLAHHYPDTPNLGDMTKIAERIIAGAAEAPDMLCGGTPCQAFSVAGLRQSLADERGNLSLVFCELADAIDTRRRQLGLDESVVFWENVPGVLNTSDNAFGCFLAGLCGEESPLVPAGGKWTNAGLVLGPKRAVAWRVLDAQYFGLAQRRKRVFVVASARSGFDPAAVLLEWDGVRRDSAPSREAGEDSANRAALSVALRGREGGATAELGDDAAGCLRASGGGGDKPHALVPARVPPIAMCLNAGGMNRIDAESETLIPFGTTQITSPSNVSSPKPGNPCHPLAAGAHAPAISYAIQAGALRTNPLSGPDGVGVQADHAYTIEARAEVQAVAFNWNAQPAQLPGPDRDTSVNDGLTCPQQGAVATAMQVRRLTPRECERLQGFPESKFTLTIEVCEDEKTENAPSAALASAAQRPEKSALVAAHVLIDFERMEVRQLKAGRFSSSAPDAGASGSSRLHTLAADSVRLAALTAQCVEQVMRTGKAASLPSISGSSCPLNGSAHVRLSGRVIAELAADGESLTAEVSRCTKFITSQPGPDSQSFALILETSLCCVAAAIVSCIQRPTSPASSFAVIVETTTPYTLIPWRKKPPEDCPDGPRYKALGNSWAVPCVRWIGLRLARHLEALA